MDLLKPMLVMPDEIDFSRYLEDTDQRDKIKPASDFIGETMHALMPAYERPDCPKIPFANFWVYCPPGKVTLWAGFNGSGKSLIQGQVSTLFAQQGFKTCIGSLEMEVGDSLARMVCQHAMRAAPGLAEVQAFLATVGENLWFYDQVGSMQPKKMLAVIRYCAEVLGVKHFVIDSMMKLVKGTDDYNGQKDLVNDLCALAKAYQIHIHLVVHVRKGEKDRADERIPTRYDISGAADISNLPDTVLIVWRNKGKERDRDAGRPVEAGDPDALIVCDKQRHCGGWEGRAKLWFQHDALRYLDRPMGRMS